MYLHTRTEGDQRLYLHTRRVDHFNEAFVATKGIGITSESKKEFVIRLPLTGITVCPNLIAVTQSLVKKLTPKEKKASATTNRPEFSAHTKRLIGIVSRIEECSKQWKLTQCLV